MNTCDACKNYTPHSEGGLSEQYRKAFQSEKFNGSCKKMNETSDDNAHEDSLGSWGCYGEPSGLFVGPKFGCIHFQPKLQQFANNACTDL